MKPKDFFLVARLKSTVNKEGFLNLKSFTDFSDRFLNLPYVFIEVFGDKRKFFIEDFYFSGDEPVVKFKNFDSINDVSFLIGKNVFTDSEININNRNNEFLVHEFIDAKVFKGIEFFGILVDVESYPGNDVMVIRCSDNKEVLVPVVKEFITRIDKKEKIIYLNPDRDLNYD
ncbi:16s rrna processing protein rimm [hydrocarbon metagenome]|uniref:16s rrna processing protein rimm n=1 Tax=hydrocarbon metagenome TaxID=938273 RepID=A0A0W8G0J4_9ZZZZ